MADTIAQAIDKVGIPVPGGASQADVKPAILTTTNGFPTTSLPSDGNSKLELKNSDPPSAIRDGASPAPSRPIPKPVEVMSVPETPVNGSTPLGQSPRPELNIPAEVTAALKSVEKPAEKPITGNTAPPDSEVLKVNDATTTQPAPPASLPKEPVQEKAIPPPQEEKKEEKIPESKPAPIPVPVVKEPEVKQAPPPAAVLPLTEPVDKPTPTPAQPLSKVEEKPAPAAVPPVKSFEENLAAAAVLPVKPVEEKPVTDSRPPVKQPEEKPALVSEPPVPVKKPEEKPAAVAVPPVSKPEEKAPVPAPAPTPAAVSAPVPVPAPQAEPTTGEKHKLDDQNKEVSPEKKAKVEPEPKKAEKPKRKNPVKKVWNKIVGKTQRKTRSQGPADGAL